METLAREMKPFRINPACIAREVSGRRLIIVYPEAANPYYLEVNDSLFNVFRAARDLGSFDEDDVADILAEPAPLSWDDVSQRLNQAESDMKAGRTMSCDAVHEQLEQNFPWLCE